MNIKEYVQRIGYNLPIYKSANISKWKRTKSAVLITLGESLKKALPYLPAFKGYLIADLFSTSVLLKHSIQPDIIILTDKHDEEGLLINELPSIAKYVIAPATTVANVLFDKYDYRKIKWYYQYPLAKSNETIIIADIIENLFYYIQIEGLPYTSSHELTEILACSLLFKPLELKHLFLIGFDFSDKLVDYYRFAPEDLNKSLAIYDSKAYKLAGSIKSNTSRLLDTYTRLLMEFSSIYPHDLSNNKALTPKISMEVLKDYE